MDDAAGVVERRVEFAGITAVIDSNVLLELYSCHDIARAPQDAKQYRIDRARDSLVLAIYLDQVRATTYGLFEAIEINRQRVPPGPVADAGERSYELLFTTMFVWFVKDHVLTRWQPIAARDHDKLRSNAADRHLEDFAYEHRKPLITREAKLAKRARARGVEVYSPREFWEGRLDVTNAGQRFLRRFDAERVIFARKYPDATERLRVLRDMFEFYRYLLLGRG